MLECYHTPSRNKILIFDNRRGLSPNLKILYDEESLCAKLAYPCSENMPLESSQSALVRSEADNRRI